MSTTQQALTIFDALMERRVSDFFDEELLGQAVDAMAVPGRGAELSTRFVGPIRQGVLRRLAAQENRLQEAVPAGVLELVIALLPSLPPPPRDLVEKLVASTEVRAEVGRLLEDTMTELFNKVSGVAPKGTAAAALGVFSWGARAASAAGRGFVSALGGDVDARIREAVELGVGLAQKRFVDLVASPENARRMGKEIARLMPRLLEMRESELARYAERVPFALLDGLFASLFTHNSGRQHVRSIVVAEAHAFVERASDTTLGELLDRLGLRAPLRAATERMGGKVVEAVVTRLRSTTP